jgi:hypothetical protein
MKVVQGIYRLGWHEVAADGKNAMCGINVEAATFQKAQLASEILLREREAGKKVKVINWAVRERYELPKH